MNKLKDFFKKNKSIFLLIITITMYLLSLFSAFSYGVECGINDNSSNKMSKKLSDYDNGYNQGFQDGVNSSTNPLVGFNNTYVDTLYQTDTEWYVAEPMLYFPINGYTYDFGSIVADLKEIRIDEGNGNDNGLSYIHLNNFISFIDNTLDFNLIGFNKVEFIYNDNSLGFTNISNYREYSTFSINNNKLVDSIKFYFNANENIQNGYIINIYTNNTYQDGYQNGYNQGLNQGYQNGFVDGRNEGLDDGYNQGYDLGYDTGYNSGYNVGNSETCKLNTLVFSLADIPIFILSKLLGFELFGMNLFVAFCSVITIVLIIFLVKKFSK